MTCRHIFLGLKKKEKTTLPPELFSQPVSQSFDKNSFWCLHSKTSLQDSKAPCSTPRLQSTFYSMPQYKQIRGRMNFDRCLTQDDLSYIIESCTLKTTQICLAYKTYLTELFYTNACPKINQKYLN